MSPVDETPETLESDYAELREASDKGDFHFPTALAEEEDAPPLDKHPYEVPANNPTHRRLRAIAGAGVPYVFLVFPPDNQVSLEFWGIAPEGLSEVLDRVSDAIS